MANNIQYSTQYSKLIDKKFAKGVKTSILENENSKFIKKELGNAKEVKIANIEVDGLGNYSRSTGYSKGDSKLEWNTYTLKHDRGRQLSVDQQDSEESMVLDGGVLLETFINDAVAPEIDATRFHDICQTTGVDANLVDTADVTLGINEIKDFIDTAMAKMTDAGVPESGRIIFLTATAKQSLKDDKRINSSVFSKPAITDTPYSTEVEYYNGHIMVTVPQSQFYSKIKLNENTTGGNGAQLGYVKDADTGQDLLVLIVHRASAIPVTKVAKPKIFMPEQVQGSDDMIIDFRLYHDCLVLKNKINGIHGLKLKK